MKVILAIALTFAIVATSSGTHIKFEECDDVLGIIQYVDVNPCNEEPCKFKKGQKVTVEMSIVPKETFENGVLSVVVDMEGVEVEYPDIETDLCKKFGCPLAKGVETKATYELIAKDFFPDMLTEVKWESKDFNQKVIFCAKAKISIES